MSPRSCSAAPTAVVAAIDEATTQIERKIRKNKTRLAKNLRAEAVLPELPEEFEAHEEGAFDIVRTKRFTVKPMSVEEAILQMNLLGHSFFVFRNTDFGDAICVVYRRNNGQGRKRAATAKQYWNARQKNVFIGLLLFRRDGRKDRRAVQD